MNSTSLIVWNRGDMKDKSTIETYTKPKKVLLLVTPQLISVNNPHYYAIISKLQMEHPNLKDDV